MRKRKILVSIILLATMLSACGKAGKEKETEMTNIEQLSSQNTEKTTDTERSTDTEAIVTPTLKQERVPYEDKKAEVKEKGSFDLTDRFDGHQIKGFGDYSKAVSYSGETSVAFAADDLKNVKNGDVLIFSFVIKAEDECTIASIDFGDKSDKTTAVTYAVPTQWSRMSFPIKWNKFPVMNFGVEGSVSIAHVSVSNRGAIEVPEVAAEGGLWLLEDFEKVAFGERGVGTGKALGITKSGNYVYTVGSSNGGSLVVTDVTDISAPKILGSVTNLGMYARNVALCQGGKDVMVVCRENGAYIINVSDPMKPYIRAHFDTVEQATGLVVAGNYALVSNRTYGVEVIDITDLDDPRHIGSVPSGEVQNAAVYDNILYAGLWGEQRVDMYDISDVYNPVLLGSVSLRGKGDGVSVAEVNGKKYLYAAHGHAQGVGQSSAEMLGYGSGNGFDIFDVTDPAKAKWCSTSYIDGRFYYLGNDFWRTHVAVDGGKVYVYVTNTYNGAYIYDATNPNAPVRLAHIKVRISITSDGAQKFLNADKVIPFDYSKYTQGVIGDVLCDGNALYIACASTGLYIWNDFPEMLHDAQEGGHNVLSKLTEADYKFPSEISKTLSNFTEFYCDGQVLTVEPNGDEIFTACGDEGIIVLDKNLKQKRQFKTKNTIVYDIAIYKDMLYAAEGTAGLAAYKINGTKLEEQWRYKGDSKRSAVVRAVELSPKARFAMIVDGPQEASVIKIEDAKNIRRYWETKSTPLYYHHNIFGLVAGRYLAVTGHNQGLKWVDFGVNDDYAEPKVLDKLNEICATHTLGSQSGLCGVGKYALANSSGAGGGYVYFDPENPGVSSYGEFTVYGKTVLNIGCKPSASPDGKWLVCTNRQARGVRILDISNINSPIVKKAWDLVGNPDIAKISENGSGGNYVLLPLGHGGLVKFDLDF